MPEQSGTLYVVGTPIGNLGDLSPRAVETLRKVAAIAAEDTRQTRKLLAHQDIHQPLIAYHAHNEASMAARLMDRLMAGEDLALVTDAGMPGISDPGSALIAAARDQGLCVTAIPGPTAMACALVLSGLPTERFVFEGFLPREGKARRRLLRELASEPRTLVLYEAPHRLAATLTDLAALFGEDRPVALCRELTKLFEEVRRGTLAALRDQVVADPPRGEMTLVIGGRIKKEGSSLPSVLDEAPDEAQTLEALSHLVASGKTRREASRILAQTLGRSRRELYALACQLEPSPVSPEGAPR